MIAHKFATHHIEHNDRFTFDAVMYSRFKYGCGKSARIFGKELALSFFKQNIHFLTESTPIVVIPSPYCFIPTATFYLKNHFVEVLNCLLVAAGRPPVEETKIHRTVTYRDDYGALSATERLQLIQNDRFHIDRDFVANKTLLFLDDVSITGTHERVVSKMLHDYGVEADCWFLYFARLTNPEVPPQVENTLNYAYVRSLEEVADIVSEGHFRFNTRVVKYILNAPVADCQRFLERQTETFRQQLYHWAIGNSYHEIEAYQANLDNLYVQADIKSLISQTQLP